MCFTEICTTDNVELIENLTDPVKRYVTQIVFECTNGLITMLR